MVTEEAIQGIQWTAGLDELRRRELRRIVGLSAAAHLIVLGFMLLGTRSASRSIAFPAVVTVDLVAVAPASPAAAPAPKPPVAKKVVLPTQPSAPKPKPKPAAKPKPEPKPDVPEKSLDDVMKELRGKAGEPAAQPRQVAGTAAIAGGARGVRVSPEVAGWLRRARIHVRQSWVVAPGFRTQALETHVVVRLDASGNVLGEPKIRRRSGNPWYDESVLRALAKASPLPAPPEAGEWPFVFTPEDLL